MENQLSSWTPRGPSQKVEAALFAKHKAVEEPRRERAVSHAVWMTPAVCLLMMGLFLRMPHAEVVMDGMPMDESAMMASLNSNLLSPTGVGKEYQSQNNWHQVTLEWTKDPKSTSSRGYFPSGKTNIQKL
jgi:hypothetical protein